MHGAEKLRIHPLFFAAGILSAFTGTLFVFLAAVLAAIEHECAHAIAAKRCGFELDTILLMPYGAVIKGDLRGIPPRQEIGVLLAGPAVSGLTALLFAACWWLYPESYAYTDTAAIVCFSLFLVNLLPAWPLDGGRILHVLLRPLGERRAKIICRAVTLAVAAGVLGYFVWSCFSAPSFSALIFCIFLLVGSFGGADYRRALFEKGKALSRGIEERRIAISADACVKDVLKFLREDRYLTLLLFEGESFLAEMSEEELLAAFGKGAYAEPLRTFAAL